MFLASFPAGPLQTNCYLVGQPGGECAIIDPGMTAAGTVQQVTAEQTTIGRERATNPYLQENML